MKKGLVLLVGILLLTGCGKKEEQLNTLSCKMNDTTGVDKATYDVTAYFGSDNKISSVKITVEFEDEFTGKVYCETYNAMNLARSEKEKVNITCDGKKIYIDDYAKFNNKSDDILDIDKDEFIAKFTKDGFECK